MMLKKELNELNREGGNEVMMLEQGQSAIDDKADEGLAVPEKQDKEQSEPGGKKRAVSQKQLEANRQNAKKGGPKTPQGKAASRMNAVTHGLLCRDVVLADEDPRAFIKLHQGLRADYQPVGEFEEQLVLRIASGFWRLQRVWKVETALLQRNIDRHEAITLRHPDMACDPLAACGLDHNNLQTLLRYETTIERQIYKAKSELERLQIARKGARAAAPRVIDVALSNRS
jgi:hypothetical protein